mmetsp:Transcript_110664/g.253484  ORF Transcript_110664/g.253484 Transcript_110664/m.253484 type:complete len:1041 (+) Transcript_110664:76-3198(+)
MAFARTLTQRARSAAADDSQLVTLAEAHFGDGAIDGMVPGLLLPAEVATSIGFLVEDDELVLMHDEDRNEVVVVPHETNRRAKRCRISVPVASGCVWTWEKDDRCGVGLAEVDWAVRAIDSMSSSSPTGDKVLVWLFDCADWASACQFCVNAAELGLAAVDALDRFSEFKKIGEGGFAQVFRVRDNLTGDLAALKVAKNGKSADARDAVEISILRQLDHASVLAFHGVFVSQGMLAIATEYASAGNVQEWLDDGSFHLDLVGSLAAQLFAGLQHIHSHDVVHRDIKPENILLDAVMVGSEQYYRAVIADFGLATFVQDEKAMLMSCGSPGYVAPEVIERKPYGKSADIFSVGAVLYACAFGRPAFHGNSPAAVLRRNLRCQPLLPKPSQTSLPASGIELIRGCLQFAAGRSSVEETLASQFLAGVVVPEAVRSGQRVRTLLSNATPRGRTVCVAELQQQAVTSRTALVELLWAENEVNAGADEELFSPRSATKIFSPRTISHLSPEPTHRDGNRRGQRSALEAMFMSDPILEDDEHDGGGKDLGSKPIVRPQTLNAVPGSSPRPGGAATRSGVRGLRLGQAQANLRTRRVGRVANEPSQVVSEVSSQASECTAAPRDPRGPSARGAVRRGRKADAALDINRQEPSSPLAEGKSPEADAHREAEDLADVIAKHWRRNRSTGPAQGGSSAASVDEAGDGVDVSAGGHNPNGPSPEEGDGAGSKPATTRTSQLPSEDAHLVTELGSPGTGVSGEAAATAPLQLDRKAKGLSPACASTAVPSSTGISLAATSMAIPLSTGSLFRGAHRAVTVAAPKSKDGLPPLGAGTQDWVTQAAAAAASLMPSKPAGGIGRGSVFAAMRAKRQEFEAKEPSPPPKPVESPSPRLEPTPPPANQKQSPTPARSSERRKARSSTLAAALLQPLLAQSERRVKLDTLDETGASVVPAGDATQRTGGRREGRSTSVMLLASDARAAVASMTPTSVREASKKVDGRRTPRGHKVDPVGPGNERPAVPSKSPAASPVKNGSQSARKGRRSSTVNVKRK